MTNDGRDQGRGGGGGEEEEAGGAEEPEVDEKDAEFNDDRALSSSFRKGGGIGTSSFLAGGESGSQSGRETPFTADNEEEEERSEGKEFPRSIDSNSPSES